MYEFKTKEDANSFHNTSVLRYEHTTDQLPREVLKNKSFFYANEVESIQLSYPQKLVKTKPTEINLNCCVMVREQQ